MPHIQPGPSRGSYYSTLNFAKVRFKLYIRFCESLLDMLTELHGGEFGGIVDNGMNDVRIIGCGTVFVLLIIAIVGMEWITRVQAVLLVLLIFSQVNTVEVFSIFTKEHHKLQIDFVIGSFLPWSVEEQARGFTGWSYDTFQQNIGPHYKVYLK